MKTSCKDCDARSPGCHGSCERYQAYRKWQDEINEKRRNANEINEGLKNNWRSRWKNS